MGEGGIVAVGAESLTAAVAALGGMERLLACAVCLGPLRTALQFHACAHVFCSECIRRALSFHARCPACRRPARQTDLVACRRLDELATLWRSHARAVGPLMAPNALSTPFAVAVDVRSVEEAPEVHEECDGCGVLVAERKMEEHRRSRCLANPSASKKLFEEEKDRYAAHAPADSTLISGDRRITVPCFSIMSDRVPASLSLSHTQSVAF